MISFIKPSHNYFIRNFEIDRLFDNFLISAVSSILVIRFFLEITKYPQLGGASFHIAHMLWGGFFLTIAFLMLLSFVTRSVKDSASIIGGIGFGVFIDELGKFITKDNNYFFEPTVALIYVIFILLYLSFRAIEKHKLFTKEEYLVNGLEMMKEAILKDMNEEEKRQAIDHLEKSGSQTNFIKTLLEILKKEKTIPDSNPGVIKRVVAIFRNFYHALLKTKWFLNFVIFFFIAKSILFIVYIGLTVASLFTNSIVLQFSQIELLSSVVSGLIVLIGVVSLRKSRLVGYTFFKRSLLLSIFLTQVYSFYRDQFSALIGLGFNIFLLITLNYMIDEERLHELGAH